mmetsp:Transcript_59304/g.94144  ORF Transcript_59304/g.94144 Transcript_59304/m.94144 type:complete len:245 (+) Transcript_59304:62-796(+)
MRSRILQALSGNILDVQLPDGISIGDARRQIAKFAGTSFSLVRLLSPLSDTLPADAQLLHSIGKEVALILLCPVPWEVASFHCCFGSEFHHPVPQIDEEHMQVDASEKLTVIATPTSLTTWENFVSQFKSWETSLPEIANTSDDHERVADVVWSMTSGLGLAGLKPDDTEDKVLAILQKDGLEEHVQKRLQELLPLLRQRVTYGNVIFPNAYEPITKRKSLGYDAQVEILSTASYYWFIGKFGR